MLARLLIAIVKLYQCVLSPWLGGRCRFEPSCSRYAVACLDAHGALRGSLLSIARLCKCHPFHPGGHDPPPPARRLARANSEPIPTRPTIPSAPRATRASSSATSTGAISTREIPTREIYTRARAHETHGASAAHAADATG